MPKSNVDIILGDMAQRSSVEVDGVPILGVQQIDIHPATAENNGELLTATITIVLPNISTKYP